MAPTDNHSQEIMEHVAAYLAPRTRGFMPRDIERVVRTLVLDSYEHVIAGTVDESAADDQDIVTASSDAEAHRVSVEFTFERRSGVVDDTTAWMRKVCLI